MLGIIILALLVMAGGAVALPVGRLFLERSAERAEGAQAAEVAVEDQYRRHPWWYITVQSTRLMGRTRPLVLRRGELEEERAEVQTAIDAESASPSTVRKLLGLACLLLLPVLFLLSCYQLIPSFYTLWGNVPLAVFGGLLVAGVEVLVAFLVARVLAQGWHGKPLPEEKDGTETATGPGPAAGRPGRRGGKPLARRVLELADSKPGAAKALLTAAMALTVAGVLVWGQLSWAPLHDTINLGNQLTIDRDKYALDKANGSDQAGLLVSDQQAIDLDSTRLSAAKARDEALAVIVPVGEDAAALPALGAVAYVAEDLRRRARHRRRARLTRQINALSRQIAQAEDAATLEAQRELVGLNHDPRLANTSAPLPGTGAQVPGQVIHEDIPDPAPGGPPGAAAQPPAAEPGGPPATADPAGAPVNVEDLFPSSPDPDTGSLPGTAAREGTAVAGTADETDHRRWTDPF